MTRHRDAVIAAIDGLAMHAVCMERDGARPGEDLIGSSLRMVHEGAGYIGIISRRYGQIPPCKDRNPDGLSITELEFNEALRLERPILLFVMDRKHPLTEDDVEIDPEKRKKLDAFRERAKRVSDKNPVHRIYDNFESFEDFVAKANRAVARLRDAIEPEGPKTKTSKGRGHSGAPDDGIPETPAFYAEPAYTGSHNFLGRRAQLATLDDWAAAADPNPVLLFDAIGGTGKSILTWTWINQNAPLVRSDWAGRFWYSFYEKGADMGDFCRRAMAYMTGQPVVRTLLKIGKLPEACSIYRGDLAVALLFNLEAHAEVLALVRQFFSEGWSTFPEGLNEGNASYLLTNASVALQRLGQARAGIELLTASLALDLRRAAWDGVCAGLSNLGASLGRRKHLAQRGRCFRAALAVAELAADEARIFRARQNLFSDAVTTGSLVEAQQLWELLDPMGRAWSRATYRPGDAEFLFAEFQYRRGLLSECEINRAEKLCTDGRSSGRIRGLHRLRGQWHQDRQEWREAAGSFSEALRMAREVGKEDLDSRAGLALARFHLGDVHTARDEAEAISHQAGGFLALAELWLGLGDHERAREHALAAYEDAWADGEPYVFWFSLERAKALLLKLGVEPPVLAPYDPASDSKYPMEDEVNAAIKKLRAEKAAEKKARRSPRG